MAPGPQILAFFDEPTNTVSYLVWDPETRGIAPLANGYQTILPPTSSFVATVRLTY